MNINPYSYLNGKEFNERVMTILRQTTIADTSRILSVPQTTFATWQTHNRTSHEIMLRLHLELNIPLELFLVDSEFEPTEMKPIADTIPPRRWLVGSDFVDKLKEVLGCANLQCLSDKLNVKKTIFSTWSTHNRTSHELIVRLALAGVATPKRFLVEGASASQSDNNGSSWNLFDELDLADPTTKKLREFLDNEGSEIYIVDGKPVLKAKI